MKYLTCDQIDLERWRRNPVGPEAGASVEFLGIVRREEGDRFIEALEYEAYEPMAEAMISRFIEEVKRLWPLTEVEVHHRLGQVPVGEVALLVGVRASHRDQVFSACRFLIDRIKEEAPIWKRAIFRAGLPKPFSSLAAQGSVAPSETRKSQAIRPGVSHAAGRPGVCQRHTEGAGVR